MSGAGLRVTHAAVRVFGQRVYKVEPPERHHHAIKVAADAEGDAYEEARKHGVEQGFVLSDGRFASRKQAYLVALRAGQLLERAPTADHWNHGLFSEDVW